MKLLDIANQIQAKVYYPQGVSEDNIEIEGIDTLETAGKGQISFLSNPAYEKFLKTTQASAVILQEQKPEFKFIQLICSNSYFAFSKVTAMFEKKTDYPKGISPHAFIDSSARIGKDVTIFPNVYIAKDAVIGDGVVIFPGCFIGQQTTIGDYTTLYSNVSVYAYCTIGSHCIFNSGTVIGVEGFGFIPAGDKVQKIPQIGSVVIGDYVETGSNCSIARSALGQTKVGSYSKFDAFVCIAHGVHIGNCCLAAAYTGFAGSAHVGNRNLFGAGSGVIGHIQTVDDVTIAAKSNISKSITQPGTYAGHPLLPIGEWRKQFAVIKNIVALKDKVKELENKLKEFISGSKN